MNILIVEDRPIFQEILKKIIADWFPSTTVVCAADGAAAMRNLTSQLFTHLLLNLQLDDVDGFEVADAALKSTPGIRIVAITSYCDDYIVYRAEKRRFRGFLDQRMASAFNCHQAIANVEVDLSFFSPSFVQIKNERIRNPLSFDKILSAREIEILELIAVPFNDQQISTTLGLSITTIKKHRFNILRKTGLDTTNDLVRYARLRGIVLSLPALRRRFSKNYGTHRGDFTFAEQCSRWQTNLPQAAHEMKPHPTRLQVC